MLHLYAPIPQRRVTRSSSSFLAQLAASTPTPRSGRRPPPLEMRRLKASPAAPAPPMVIKSGPPPPPMRRSSPAPLAHGPAERFPFNSPLPRTRSRSPSSTDEQQQETQDKRLRVYASQLHCDEVFMDDGGVVVVGPSPSPSYDYTPPESLSPVLHTSPSYSPSCPSYCSKDCCWSSAGVVVPGTRPASMPPRLHPTTTILGMMMARSASDPIYLTPMKGNTNLPPQCPRTPTKDGVVVRLGKTRTIHSLGDSPSPTLINRELDFHHTECLCVDCRVIMKKKVEGVGFENLLYCKDPQCTNRGAFCSIKGPTGDLEVYCVSCILSPHYKLLHHDKCQCERCVCFSPCAIPSSRTIHASNCDVCHDAKYEMDQGESHSDDCACEAKCLCQFVEDRVKQYAKYIPHRIGCYCDECIDEISSRPHIKSCMCTPCTLMGDESKYIESYKDHLTGCYCLACLRASQYPMYSMNFIQTHPSLCRCFRCEYWFAEHLDQLIRKISMDKLQQAKNNTPQVQLSTGERDEDYQIRPIHQIGCKCEWCPVIIPHNGSGCVEYCLCWRCVVVAIRSPVLKGGRDGSTLTQLSIQRIFRAREEETPVDATSCVINECKGHVHPGCSLCILCHAPYRAGCTFLCTRCGSTCTIGM